MQLTCFANSCRTDLLLQRPHLEGTGANIGHSAILTRVHKRVKLCFHRNTWIKIAQSSATKDAIAAQVRGIKEAEAAGTKSWHTSAKLRTLIRVDEDINLIRDISIEGSYCQLQ